MRITYCDRVKIKGLDVDILWSKDFVQKGIKCSYINLDVSSFQGVKILCCPIFWEMSYFILFFGHFAFNFGILYSFYHHYFT